MLRPDAPSGQAARFGVSPGELGGSLSQRLPQAVHRLTPEGRLPDAADGSFGDLGAILGRFR